MVVHAERNGRRIHDFQTFLQHMEIGQFIVLDRIVIFQWIAVINTIHLSSFKYN